MPMLLFGMYPSIVLVLMHVEILYTQWYMFLCYCCPYAIVWKVHTYCSSTNTHGDTFYTVVCMYLWYSCPYAIVWKEHAYCSSTFTLMDTFYI